MAHIVRTSTENYKRLKFRGIFLVVAPKVITNTAVALGTMMFNMAMQMKPESIIFTINQYSDGHLEYTLPDMPGFQVIDGHKWQAEHKKA